MGDAERVAMTASDSRSGAAFERVVVDGEPHVIKYLHVDDDWIMRSRATWPADPSPCGRAACSTPCPPCLDHAVVGAAAGLGRHGWGAALLMRGRAPPTWCPSGDDPIPLDQQLGFMDHMAALHADSGAGPTTSGWPRSPTGSSSSTPTPSPARRSGMARARCRPWSSKAGAASPRRPARGRAMIEWSDDRPRWSTPWGPDLRPSCTATGRWATSGTRPDGRTVLLDWAVPGQGNPPTLELAWYLALNTARLPQPKEDAIEAYRGPPPHGSAPRAGRSGAVDLALLGRPG